MSEAPSPDQWLLVINVELTTRSVMGANLFSDHGRTMRHRGARRLRGRRSIVGAMVDIATLPTVGALLRDWRTRRHLSQLDLALEAGVSARHLSFVETGRSRPSREMVLRLADQLEVPLRERNRLLLAAGYAPAYGERALDDARAGAGARGDRRRCCAAHEPYPAVVVDRALGHGRGATAASAVLTEGVAPAAARAAGQRAAREPAPGRRRAADREPRRVARASARAPRAPGRSRPATPRSRRCYEELERATRRPSGAATPHAGPEIAVPLRLRTGDGGAELLQHGRHIRDGHRGHRRRARDRVVLPG